MIELPGYPSDKAVVAVEGVVGRSCIATTTRDAPHDLLRHKRRPERAVGMAVRRGVGRAAERSVSRSIVRAFLPLPLGIGLALAGCSEGAEPTLDRQTVSDSAGVRIVTSPGDRVERALPWSIEVVPHLHLGVVEGPDALQFMAPTAAFRLSDGSLIVSEPGVRLRLFDAQGTFIRWIGALGEGPEEFLAVSAAGALVGDTVAVFDGRRRRILHFTSGGTFVRGFPVQLPEAFSQVRSSRFLPDGRLALEGWNPGLDQLDIPERQERLAAILLDRDGQNPVVLAEADGLRLRVELRGGGDGVPGTVLMANVNPTFHPIPRFTATEAGTFRWDGASFEVQRLNDEGQLDAIHRAALPARRVTPEVIRTWEEGPGASVSPDLRAIRERALGGSTFADSLPHFQIVLPSPDGALWLGAFVGHTGGFPSRWWRMDPDGGVDGWLDLPEGFRVLSFGEGEVLGVERDALEVPFITGYRLIPADPAPLGRSP